MEDVRTRCSQRSVDRAAGRGVHVRASQRSEKYTKYSVTSTAVTRNKKNSHFSLINTLFHLKSSNISFSIEVKKLVR